MKIRLIRHATVQIELGSRMLLIDPMFAEPYAFPSLTVGASSNRNPLVPLPCSMESLLHPDAVVVTHAHFDHFDGEAVKRLSKELPLFCQGADLKKIRKSSFLNLFPVGRDGTSWNGLRFIRTGGIHGTGLVGKMMGTVSGFIIEAEDEPGIYVVGDTIWCPEVKAALEEYQPDVIVVNAGAAQFNFGAPITMGTTDIVEVCKAAPSAQVVAVHLEAVNHCRLTRKALAEGLEAAGVREQVLIPQDGEELLFPG